MKNKQQQKLNDKILKAANRKEIRNTSTTNTSKVMETSTSKQNKGI